MAIALTAFAEECGCFWLFAMMLSTLQIVSAVLLYAIGDELYEEIYHSPHDWEFVE